MKECERYELKWTGDKSCRIRSIGTLRFFIEDSRNIKLLPGDEVTLHTLWTGHPLYATEITRQGACIGSYVGAMKSGLQQIRKI